MLDEAIYKRFVPLFDPLPGGGLPVRETEQSADPFATNDATGLGYVDQSVPQPLMVPLAMVARHVLGDCMSQMSRV